MARASGISRRLLMGAGGAALAGCATPWPRIPPLPSRAPPTPVVDVHSHQFNAADLPAAGFIKYTFLRPYADRGAARALVDLVVHVVKPLALTVVEELHDLQQMKALREVDMETFARGASDRARGLPPSVGRLAARAPGEAARPPNLDDDYRELATILEAANAAPGFSASAVARGRRAAPDYADVFRRAAQAAEPTARPDDGAAARRAVSALRRGGRTSAVAAADDEDFVGSILRTFAWVVIMLQPRSSHLQRYVKTYSHDGLRPVKVVNLLVDMGAWLQGEEDARADSPSPGAFVPDQVRFWTEAAKHYAGSIEVLTFAPYCPLQHAYDIRDQTHGGRYLKQLEDWYASGVVAGFKLYPPMGYFPTGNRGRPDRDYIGKDGIRGGVVRAWNAGGAANTLGTALENALDAFYGLCKARDIPIVAHSGPSNVTSSDFLDRPNPVHWKPVAEMGVRLMLGHFALDAKEFVAAMRGEAAPPVWAIESAAPLLKAHRNVFIDISYLNEVLGTDPASTASADAFYAELLRYATDARSPGKACDPELDQIVYGSDWIMLEREADHRRYLQIARDRIEDWPERGAQKILGENAERFLRRTPQSTASVGPRSA